MATLMTSETRAMKPAHAVSMLLLLALGGCKIRNPFGGCPYEDVELSPQFVTPWDTVLDDDMAALTGPFPGALAWLDGDDVITVPKAGQVIEVEAEVEIDVSTARMREYIRGDREAACEPDRIFVDGKASFVRSDNGEVEIVVPITAYRDELFDYYNAEAETPVEDFAPDLVPMEQHESQAIFSSMRWAYDTGDLYADFTYSGQTTDSPSTGHGSFKKVAEFIPAD